MSNEKTEKVLKVSGNTPVHSLATSINATYKEEPSRTILLKAVGADAVNQALKSVIIANRTFIKQGQIARIFPAFETLGREEDEKTQSGIVLQLEISRV